jgi:hypothetical protein
MLENLSIKLKNMKTTKLEKLHACSDAREWVKTQKSAVLAWQNCERGDWMLWLAKKLNVDDKKFTLAKVMCAKQVEHLMKDQRSKDALVACLKYVNGEITREELYAAAADAAAAAYDAYAAYAAAAAAAYAAADAARFDSLKKSADICREYLTDEVLSKYNKLK